MQISSLTKRLGVPCIVSGVLAAGCVKYNVITNPVALKVAMVASVALPLIGILALLLAWLLSRRDRAATDENPASAHQDLAPPPSSAGKSSEPPPTVLETPSSAPSLGTEEPSAPPKHTGTGYKGNAVPPHDAPIREDSVSSMHSIARTASTASTNSSAEDVTPPNSFTSPDAPIAPTGTFKFLQPKSGKIVPNKRTAASAAALAPRRDPQVEGATNRRQLMGSDSLDQPLTGADVEENDHDVIEKSLEREKSKNEKTEPKTPPATPAATPPAKGSALRTENIQSLGNSLKSNKTVQAAARKAVGPKPKVSPTTGSTPPISIATMILWGAPPPDDDLDTDNV